MGFELVNDPDLPLFLTVIACTILLNSAHICANIETVFVNALFVFFCYSFYFALLGSRLKDRPLPVLSASVVIFASIGFVVGYHFAISPLYGISFGILQGLVIPLVLWPISNVSSPDSLIWLLSVTSTWTAINVLVAYSYGIAVTLPIQLYRFPLLLQPISVLGFASLDAFVIACNCLLGSFLLKFSSERLPVLRCLPLVRLFVLVTVWFILASFLWYSYDDNEDDAAKVATLSPGYRFDGNLTDLINMTRNAASADAQYIVWPETYVRSPKDSTCEEYILREIVPEIKMLDVFVVIGCYQHLSSSSCVDANLAITIGPGGTLVGTYGKEHPVSMIGEKSCLTNGYHAYSMEENGLFFSTLICYDMDFSDSAANVADLGASLILNPSEDWSAARGHFAASVFRAVENRVAVAKSDWGWDSAIIDALGRIVAIYDSKSIHRETLVARVPLFAQETKFHRISQMLVPILAFLTSIFLCFFSFMKMSPNTRTTDLETPML